MGWAGLGWAGLGWAGLGWLAGWLGFGSGVLSESFERVLFFALVFEVGSGLGWDRGLALLGWGWAVELGRGGWAGGCKGAWGCWEGLRELWGLDIGELGWDFLAGLWGWNWAGISSNMFNEISKLMKMQFKAKFTQFLFILLLRV